MWYPSYRSTEALQKASVPEMIPSAKTSAVSLSHPLRPQPISAAALVSTPLLILFLQTLQFSSKQLS